MISQTIPIRVVNRGSRPSAGRLNLGNLGCFSSIYIFWYPKGAATYHTGLANAISKVCARLRRLLHYREEGAN